MRIVLRAQEQQPRATVVRIGPALDQAASFQLFDHARQGDRLDLQHFGKRHLVAALIAGQMEHGLPLRAGEAERAGAAFEILPHQARRVVQQKADGVLAGLHGRSN